MDSERFPGKMTGELCGLPLIQFVINRARQVRGLSSLVVATTERPADDVLVKMAEECGTGTFRGSTNDVASRFLGCARSEAADYFIRLNGDSPCLDAGLIERGIDLCSAGYDIITNIPSRTFPYGISLEIVRTAAFAGIYAAMDEPDREHVTGYFYRHLNEFNIKEILNDAPGHDDSRYTIDVPADLERLRRFFNGNPNRSWRDE